MDSSFLIFLQKSPLNMMLFGTAVVTGGMMVYPLFGRLFSGSTAQVGALEAVQLINRRDAVVLDARDAAEFAAGHVPNARNLPFADLQKRMRELERYKLRPVLVHSQSVAQAAKISAILKTAGFAEVFALRGGLPAWVEASLPVEKSGARPAPEK